MIRQQAAEKEVDAALIAAVIYAESKFADETSSAGARGLMQITPEAAKEIERLSGGTTFKLDDLSNPEINIRYGTFLLRELLERFGRNEVAAHNAGPANVEKWGGAGLSVEDIPYPGNPGPTSRGARQAPGLPRQVPEGAGLPSAAPRPRVGALALAVGLVLADSSVVVLALPQIYRELDTSVAGVTWVLVSFNLVMALVAVPAALVARRVGPGWAAAFGLAVFAGAGLACGLSDNLTTLIAARCLQAVRRRRGHRGAGAAAGHGRLGGAGDRDLGERPGDRRGPRPGGRRHPHPADLLAVDLPAAGARPWSRRCRSSPSPATRRRPGSSSRSCAAPAAPTSGRTLALVMVAAIAAALFLLVLLLIEGWRLSPIGAAIVVTAMPLAALLGTRLSRFAPDARARAAAGAILVAGGLAGLGLLPRAEVALTLPPQILVGIGLSLVLSALTETALSGRARQAIHGGWTIWLATPASSSAFCR